MQLIQSDKKRVVVGLGLTGRSTMRFFQRMGLPFVAVDTREAIPDMASLREEFPDLPFYLGRSLVDVCPDASEIYLSPGLAIDAPDIVALRERGAQLSGDLDLFMAQVSEPVFAISGSNAKSTVTTLLGEMIAASGRSVGVGGNLGKPMLDLLEEKHDCYVLEISSFQLERATAAKFAAAALLNISADHMDRHKTLVEYHRVKQSLFAATDIAVFNRQDPLTQPLQRAGMALRSFGWQPSGMADFCVATHGGREMICKGVNALLAVDELKLPGRHNVLNVMAALALADAAGISLQTAADTAKNFTGLAHRCEWAADIGGVAFINDSKATNVGACIAALQGFAQASGKVVLIAGGQTKAADFAPLAKALASVPCELVLLGEGAQEIAEACRSGNNGELPIHFANNMDEAVASAMRVAVSGDIVLLSPACASFDMYSGFEARGDAFKAAVNALASGGAKLMRTQVRSGGLPSLSPSSSLRWFGLDGWLLFAAGALLAIGLVMITSASLDYAGRRHGNALFYVYRHAIYIVIAACAAFVCLRVPVSTWRRYAVHMLVASFGLLVLIFIPGLGHTANSATRWLALGPFTLQVSEVAKLGVVFYLASYLVRQERLVRSHVLGFFNPMLVMMLLVVLLLLQPDFGAVVVMLGAALGLLFLGGVRLWQFGLLIAASVAAIAVMVLTEEYRMARFVSFLDPWSYQQGGGYQLIQSLIAFGRGEFFGLGLGNSIQKLFFLPEAHTDFIFAVLAEELGMAGCVIVLSLFALLISRLLLIAQNAQAAGEDFGAYVVYGIALIFAIQCFINVGVNIGLLPTKGLTLPFLSYGGSSLLVSCASVAIALRIEREIHVRALDNAQRRGDQPVSRSVRHMQGGVGAHA